MESVLGIAKDRELPTFTRETLVDWFEERGGAQIPAAEADHRVLLFPDTYTNYSYPESGKATVRVLESAGVHVSIPTDLEPSGRAAYSKGFLDLAGDRAEANVSRLQSRVDDGFSVVFVEPSDAVMFQDEYRDLLSGPDVEAVSNAAYGVCEFLDVHRLDGALETPDPESVGSLTYHGHCNQKATNKDHHAVGVLRRVGYAVDPLDSGCCGMAGSFGYEAEHFELSKAIGRILFRQVSDSEGDRVTAPGASCRSQLGDRGPSAENPPHPIELVAEALD
jgi:Fe-S oxidoreductase